MITLGINWHAVNVFIYKFLLNLAWPPSGMQ